MKKSKKRGAMHLVRILVFILKRRSTHKSSSIEADRVMDSAPQRLWKNLVGALHHNHLHNSSLVGHHAQMMSRHYADPPAPHFFNATDGMSQYTSAENLKDLDENERREDDEGNFNGIDEDGDDGDGPNAIDVRAEEFIANFYEEMRLQRSDSIKRYNEMLERGTR